VLALAFLAATPALGTRQAQRAPVAAAAAAPCATVSAQGAGTRPLAVYTVGAVSCANARTLATSFLQKAANGGCPPHPAHPGDQRCFIGLPGGWRCDVVLTEELPDSGGTFGSCFRDHPNPVIGLLAEIRFFAPGSPPGRLQLDEFRSANLHVWCGINTDVFGSATTFCIGGGDNPRPGGPERGGFLNTNGRVRTCSVAHAGFRDECVQNWNFDAPPLVDGQQTEAHGVLCTATNGGVRCVGVSGARKGRGFFVSRTVARRIVP
jgi:hypothetical protein